MVVKVLYSALIAWLVSLQLVIASGYSPGPIATPVAANQGGTGLSASGTDTTYFLGSDGSNGYVMAVPAGGGGGSGTVNSGTSGRLTYYASTGTAVSGNANVTVSGGVLTLGQAGTAGSVVLNGATSGTCTISVPATAGSATLAIPAANCNPIVPDTGASNNFLTGINSSGVISKGQPSFSNLSGSMTLAQMPAQADLTILGNVSGSSAVPVALTQAQATTVLNAGTDVLKGLVPPLTDGKIIVGKTGSAIQAVSPSGDVASISNAGAVTLSTVNSNVGSFTNANITVNAKGLITAASNGSAGGGGGYADGGSKTSSFSAAAATAYNVTGTSGTIICTLPTAVGVAWQSIYVVMTGTGATLQFNTTSSQTISGQASAAITTTAQYNGYEFISDGANWHLK